MGFVYNKKNKNIFDCFLIKLFAEFELTDEAGRTLEVDGNLAEKLKVSN